MLSLKIFPLLLALSYVYVGLPWVLFLLGWLRWYLAWPALAALIAAGAGMLGQACQAVMFIRSPRHPQPEAAPGATRQALQNLFRPGTAGLLGQFPISRGPLGWFCRYLGWFGRCGMLRASGWAVVAFLLVSLSGAGGVGLQEGDYFKHNALLKHLIDSPWPVWLPTDQGPFPLVYYLGWYLPAAAVGKLWGWQVANIFLFIWTYLGVLLALAWFTLLVGRCHGMVLWLFFFFSAPDVLGAALFKLIGWDPGPPLPPPIRDSWGIDWFALRWWNWELRWWAGPYTWNYCSQMELLFWVPQQALGAWICTGMMAASFFWPMLPARKWILVPMALSALWSPLVSLGLTPLVLVELLGRRKALESPTSQTGRFSRLPRAFGLLRGIVRPWQEGLLGGWIAWPNGAAGVLLAIGGLYYAAHFAPLPFSNDPRAEFRFLGFDDWPMGMYLVRLMCFWIVDVLSMVGLILLVRRPRKPAERTLFYTALAVLLALALCRYGLNNDLGMRVSMPWLFVLGILLAKGAIRRRLPPIRRWILFGAFAIMAATPVSEVYRHLREMHRQGRWGNIPEVSQVQSLWELNASIRHDVGNDFFLRQYIGSPDTVFFRYLTAPDKPIHH